MSRETLTLAEIERYLKRKKHPKKAKKKAKRKTKRRAKPKVKIVHVHHHHGKKTAARRAAPRRLSSARAPKKKRAKPASRATGAAMSPGQRKAWAKKMQLARKKAARKR